MVRNKIKDEHYTTPCEFLSGRRKSFPTPQATVDLIASNTVWGTNVVFCPVIRQCPPEICEETFVLIRYVYACGASLPDTHKPNGIHAKVANCVPLLLRDSLQCYESMVFYAQLVKPHPGVYLINDLDVSAMGSFFHLTFRLSTNEGRTLADLKHLLGIEKSKELDHLRHQPGPSRLVAGA